MGEINNEPPLVGLEIFLMTHVMSHTIFVEVKQSLSETVARDYLNQSIATHVAHYTSTSAVT